jgi:hypothetical protein
VGAVVGIFSERFVRCLWGAFLCSNIAMQATQAQAGKTTEKWAMQVTRRDTTRRVYRGPRSLVPSAESLGARGRGYQACGSPASRSTGAQGAGWPVPNAESPSARERGCQAGSPVGRSTGTRARLQPVQPAGRPTGRESLWEAKA